MEFNKDIESWFKNLPELGWDNKLWDDEQLLYAPRVIGLASLLFEGEDSEIRTGYVLGKIPSSKVKKYDDICQHHNDNEYANLCSIIRSPHIVICDSVIKKEGAIYSAHSQDITGFPISWMEGYKLLKEYIKCTGQKETKPLYSSTKDYYVKNKNKFGKEGIAIFVGDKKINKVNTKVAGGKKGFSAIYL